MPRASAEEGTKRRCGNLLRQEIYKNIVSSVEAETGIAGQIMFVEQCTFYILTVAFLGPQNAPKIVGGWGFAPDPTGGAYSAPPDP